MFSKIINISVTLILITGLSVLIYVWRGDLVRGLQIVYTKIELQIYPPCSRVISYRLGDFSDQFGISREQFIEALKEAETIWEDPIGRDLFSYNIQGDLVVNLIYDSRQEVTNTLKDINASLDRSRTSYEIIKIQYQQRYAQYEQMQIEFETMVENYEIRRSAYEKQVSSFNKRGGANEAQYAHLEADRQALNQDVETLRVKQSQLQILSQEINSLVEDLNNRATELNLAVDEHNSVGGAFAEEFDGGLYRINESGRAIDVFQFDNYQQLVRLLAHEFGHALGIDHIEDPDAIMYRLNQSADLYLTQNDLEALKKACSIQ
jgi:hypothetical protein